MNKAILEKNLQEIHQIFRETQEIYNGLPKGISEKGPERDILDNFLEALNLEKNPETRYAASQRLGNWKFESLADYLQKQSKTQAQQDEMFEKSYILTREFVEQRQKEALKKLREKKLLPEFYMTLLEKYHEVGKAHSILFLKWNRELLFRVNRELEKEFAGDNDTVIAFLSENDLFDQGHH